MGGAFLAACGVVGGLSSLPGGPRFVIPGREVTPPVELRPFRREHAPPAPPRFEPLPNGGVVARRTFDVAWMPNGDPDAVKGYGYAVAPADEPGVALPETPNTEEPRVTLEVPKDGAWTVLVRTLDNWGTWSEPASTSFVVDSVPLTLSGAKTRTAVTNPDVTKVPVWLTLNKAANVSVSFIPANGKEPLRTISLGAEPGETKVEWDGRDDAGEYAPPGVYRVRIAAGDAAGNEGEVVLPRVALTQKRIYVSIARQTLWAYEGSRVFLQTLVTTGGPQTQTVTGSFEIMTRQTPFTFRSPWPKGHPFWYEDSPATYAMLFADGGFFLHDAPWRSNFGPGSNTRYGTPGGNFTGTHGCVNIPAGVARQIFFWSEIGVPVIVE